MKFRFWILFFLVGFQNLAIAQFQISFSQTRGCGTFITVVTLTNNGFCNAPDPVASIEGPGLPINGLSFTGIGGNNFTQSYPVNAAGIFNVTLTCSNGGTATKGNLGIYQIQGLDNRVSNFTISSCQGNETSVILNNPVYDKYQVNWGDGNTSTVGRNSSTTQQIRHTYGDQITKTISVTGIYEYTVAGTGLVNTCRKDSVGTATPYPALTPPELFQLAVNNLNSITGQATLDIRTDERLKYRISQRTSTSAYLGIVTIPNITFGVPNTNATQSVQVGGLNTLGNTYCYKIEAFDDCGNIAPTSTPVQSENQLCTLPIFGNAIATGNDIRVGNYDRPTADFSLSVSGFALVDTTISRGFNYLDENVLCGLNYEYRASAKTEFPTIEQVSISAPLSILAIKKSALVVNPPTDFLASYGKTDQNLTLNWTPLTSTGVTYVIYAEGNTKPLVSVQGTNTFKAPVPLAKCYLVSSSTDCGTSNTLRACPPNLQAQKDNLEQNSAQWTDAVTGDNDLVSNYALEFYVQGGGTIPYKTLPISTNSYIHNPIDTNSQVTVYRVIGFLPDGVTEVRSDFIAVKQDVRLFMPTAFSPNSDNLNDVFSPKGLFWEEFELSIFNRWGQNVFYSTDKNKGWDGGQFNPDLYHYVAKVKDQFGDELVKNGTFQLIK
ncbi:MAG: gliding motility-associated C-terminal domain-containing protein [Cytophagales bacterium]